VGGDLGEQIVDEVDEQDERDGDEQLLRDIQEVGWHVVLIREDEEGPAFGFTVGLYHSYGHPEVLIHGFGLELTHQILNNIGDEVKAGHQYEAGRRYPDILEGYDCAFQIIEKAFYHEYLGYARWYYRGNNFPALQCLLPDREGRFPGDAGFPEQLAKLQQLKLPAEPDGQGQSR
jgi:Domain of unknown function (DUF4262)